MWISGASAPVRHRDWSVSRPWARASIGILAGVLLAVGWLIGPALAANPVDLRLGPGDKVSVGVLRRPDLSGEFRVLPSGELQLPLVGRVPAGDQTLDEVQQTIADRLKTTAFLLDPKVSLDLVEASPITVGGDVQRPGAYPYQTGMTVQHAVAFAGGRRVVDIDAFNARSEMHRTRERLLQTLDQYGMTLLRRSRLEAENRDGTEIPVPVGIERWLTPDRLEKGLATERDLLQHRETALAADLQSYAKQATIFDEEIRDLQEQDNAKAREGDVIRQELDIQQQLLNKGIVVRERAIEFQRLSMQLHGDRSQIAADIAKARQDRARIDQAVQGLKDQRRLEIANLIKDATDTLANLDVTIDQSRKALRDADESIPDLTRAADDGSPYVIVRGRSGTLIRIAATPGTEMLPGDMVIVARP